MKMADKIKLAQWIKESVVPYVCARGQHTPAGIDGPSNWRVQSTELTLIYTEQALLDPADRSLSCLLDVWAAAGPKVLSIAWEPSRPWQPPQIVRLLSGDWLEDLTRLAL